MNVVGPMFRSMRARKEYKCSGCGKPIEPGTIYDREAVPPWLDYDGDVDDEGRPIAYLKDPSERAWYTTRWHPPCYERYYYGY